MGPGMVDVSGTVAHSINQGHASSLTTSSTRSSSRAAFTFDLRKPDYSRNQIKGEVAVHVPAVPINPAARETSAMSMERRRPFARSHLFGSFGLAAKALNGKPEFRGMIGDRKVHGLVRNKITEHEVGSQPARRSAMLLPWRTFCVARWWSPIKRRARRMWKRTCGSGCRRSECGIRVGRGTRGL